MSLLYISLALGLAWALGQVFRDLTTWTAILFYLPSPVIGVASLLAALLAWRRRRRILAAASALLCAGALGATWGENPRLFVRPSGVVLAPDTITLLHWNVCRGCQGWPQVVDALRRHPADVVLLSEFPKSEDVRATAAALGAEYQGRKLGTMAVLGRGSRLSVESLLNAYELEGHRVIWGGAQDGANGAQSALEILAVDVVATPLVARHPQLGRIQAWIEAEQPDLVVGDFNAPRRSWRLARLPAGYADAYDVAGTGWAGTWPSRAPIWALDHVLVGPRVRARHFDTPFLRGSDHRAQWLELELFPPPSGSVAR